MNFLQIVQKVCQRAGEEVPAALATATGRTAIVMDLVNEVYQDVETMKKWWWLEASGTINPLAMYNTGTATVSAKAVTGVGTAWTTAAIAAGDWFQFVGDTEYYVIASIGGELAITLEESYIGTAPGSTYRIVRPEYSLPSNYGRIKWVEYPKRGDRLVPVAWHDFQTRRSSRGNYFSYGDPEVYSVYGYDTNEYRRIHLDPAPETAHPIYIQYIKFLPAGGLVADADTPLIPDKYRYILVHGTLARYYKDVADEPQQAQQSMEMYQRGVDRMMQEQDAHDAGAYRMKADMSDWRIQKRQVRRGGTSEADSMIHRSS